MSLAAVPIIPESAKGYSLRRNVLAALSQATEAVWSEEGDPTTTVHPMLLMHHFLQGMPAAGENARELSSSLGQGSTESPLFDKVFQVPLPIEEQNFAFDAEQSTYELLKALDAAGNLPSPYKTDIVVFDNADMGTLKITKWHQDDPRGEVPHNHPWADEEGVSFISYIVRGGYTETITNTDGTTTTREYRAGDRNVAMYADFHTVGNILPGTLTILMCAPRAVVETKGEEWGYLIFDDNGKAERVGMKDPRVADQSFLHRAAVLNPDLRFIYKK